MRECIQELQTNSSHHPQLGETVSFLEWLLQDNFTFLGARDYKLEGKGDEQALRLISGSGLGVLRNEERSKTRRLLKDLPEAAQKLALSEDNLLIISQTNTRSTVHRAAYTCYIGIKQFNLKGQLIGERRFIGLYTSTAYHSNPKTIPFIRQKVDWVLLKSSLPEKSHSGKDLMHILSTLPRDDLFHASVEELYAIATGILHLQERRQIRLFAREDAYGRFISCYVFVPRDNFNADLVRQMQEILREAFGGYEISLSTYFSPSVLVRIHFVIRVNPRHRKPYDLLQLEQELVTAGESWRDGFRKGVLEYFGEEKGMALFNQYANAFPAGYREVFSSRKDAVLDILQIENLSPGHALGMSFYRPLGSTEDIIHFKLFRESETVPLSDVLPLLENMGLRVIGEQPYQINLHDSRIFWINDFSVTYANDLMLNVEEVKTIFQQAFYKIWLGEAENDSLNRLVLGARLNWRDISLLRAYAKYLWQLGFTFSFQYIAEALTNNPSIAKLLVRLFYCRFDPGEINREEKMSAVEIDIKKQLNDVAILDEDRILRRYLEVMRATIRTNYFQVEPTGTLKVCLSFKLDPSKIPEIPKPIPQYEIYVYSARFEGVHLRAGKVARGGIRWSDRKEDFRTEVLGLMKAQQVKNALIVPAGAKGGFVPKNLPINVSKEEILEEGITCYRYFIHGLLDVTDNLEGDVVVPPLDTVCYDTADPYFVVAADKGTATFSDIANSIAIERGYWLGDAFASGGSNGYDHKKMGITARGAWVSAERQFQELGINVDNTEITVVGIGDMSGDVFGNGLLLSRHIRLVAAFNHEHIFVDPNPNPEVSYEERLRLFHMPRSSWNDYQRELLSEGGAIYPRHLKSIRLSAEAKELLSVDADSMVPSELIRSILKAKVDLIWNGGIGTYVKASDESNSEVGDRANDVLRVNGNELQARVICEGGNLGFTQRGRIEYEFHGGKINTDFIDNSAGVDCSDHEVNIKILLDSIVSVGELTEKQKNALLFKMTDEVAELVLQNNYHQNQSIGLAATLSPQQLGLYKRYIEVQEQAGKLNRELEFLPDNKVLAKRKSEGMGLTKPEIAILLAYSKIILEEEIRKSDLPDDPYLSQCIQEAFPTPLRKRYSLVLSKHRLHKEIVSTQLSNRLVSDMGINFVQQMQDQTGASIPFIIRAYTVAREIFGMADMYADIESLDYQVSTNLQYRMREEVIGLIRRATRWIIGSYRHHGLDVSSTIEYFSTPIAQLFKRLPKLLLGEDKVALETYREKLINANVPPAISLKIASVNALYHALNIIGAATAHQLEVQRVAKVYFILVDRLRLSWFREQINVYPEDNRWVTLGKSACKADLDSIQQELTVGVLKFSSDIKETSLLIDKWFDKNRMLISRWNIILADLYSLESKEFAILSVALRELGNLAKNHF